MAVSLYATLMLVGVFAGVFSHFADHWHTTCQLEHNFQQLAGDNVIRHKIQAPEIVSELHLQPPTLSYGQLAHDSTVAAMLLLTRQCANSDSTSFRMQRLADDGFKLHEKPLIELLTLPFSQLNSLAAGDVNNDHWEDLLVSTSQGVFMYLNTGGRFTAVALPFQQWVTDIIGSISLVDFNNDGWLDMFFNRSRSGNYMSYNHAAEFQRPQRLFYMRLSSVMLWVFGILTTTASWTSSKASNQELAGS